MIQKVTINIDGSTVDLLGSSLQPISINVIGWNPRLAFPKKDDIGDDFGTLGFERFGGKSYGTDEVSSLRQILTNLWILLIQGKPRRYQSHGSTRL